MCLLSLRSAVMFDMIHIMSKHDDTGIEGHFMFLGIC